MLTGNCKHCAVICTHTHCWPFFLLPSLLCCLLDTVHLFLPIQNPVVFSIVCAYVGVSLQACIKQTNKQSFMCFYHPLTISFCLLPILTWQPISPVSVSTNQTNCLWYPGSIPFLSSLECTPDVCVCVSDRVTAEPSWYFL